jgi:hypothetical protein
MLGGVAQDAATPGYRGAEIDGDCSVRNIGSGQGTLKTCPLSDRLRPTSGCLPKRIFPDHSAIEADSQKISESQIDGHCEQDYFANLRSGPSAQISLANYPQPRGARHLPAGTLGQARSSTLSQFMTPIDWAYLGKERIKRRLIGELDPEAWDLPPKPKWMRWKTYHRLVEQFDRYEVALDRAALSRATKLLRRS